MAFPLDLKVVKVGDIVAPPEEQSYLWPDISTSENPDIAVDQFSWRNQHPVRSVGWSLYHNHDQDLVKPVNKELDLPDEPGAPTNWPQIPQLSRRRSCEATGERTNCVNKAVEHLQLLQDILTDWVQKTEEEEKVSEDTDADTKSSISDFDPKNKEVALVPLTTEFVPSTNVEAFKDFNSHAHLKGVVNEVMLLLAWLHDDCQKTEAKLDSEKALESQLSLEIDEMSRKKLIDLTDSVQEAYDSCKVQNRTSLVTFTYLSRIQAKCQKKLKLLQNLNFHLTKDIAISNKQIPLVQDKLLLENQGIDKLQNILNEDEQMLTKTKKNEAVTDAKYKKAVKICKHEQQRIDTQFNAVSHELNLSANAAETAEKRFYEMSQGIVDGKQKNTDNEKEITILKVKLENRKAKTNAIQLQNKDDKENLVKQLQLTKKLKSMNHGLEEEIKEKTNEFNDKKTEIVKVIGFQEQRLKYLKNINNSKAEQIQSIQLKIEESQKQREFYEKSLKRVTRENMKIENQITLTSEELKRMQEMNRLLSKEIEVEHIKNLEKEKSLEQTVNYLKREVEHENKIYLDMTNQISNLEFEVRSQEAEAAEKKQKLLSKTNEVTAYLEKVNDKISSLSDLKEQKEKALIHLKENMKDVDETYSKIIQDNEEYMANLTPYLEKAEEKSRELKKKVDGMAAEEERMNTEIKLMTEQCKALENLVKRIEQETEKLTDTVQEHNFQLEATSKLSTNTNDRWDQVSERLNQEQTDHDNLMCCRKETLEEILQKKQQNLKENEQLATKYRANQETLVQKKKEYLQLSGDTLLIKQALKDIKQLLNLQIKMQYNSKNYFQYRGLYHSKQLAYIVDASEGNQVKIKQLQYEFKSTMDKMTNHLKGSMSRIFHPKLKVLPKITDPTS